MIQLSVPRLELLKAADILEERGHCKHVLLDGQRVCVAGAINIARHGNVLWPDDDLCSGATLYGEAFELLSDYIGRDPISWNNEPERTPDEVTAALRAAAVKGL